MWGRLVDTRNRVELLVLSMFVWSAATGIIGLSSSLLVITAARCVNGVALTALNPLVASLASDLFPSERRGQVFGIVTAISAVGHIIGSVMTTDMSEKSILGIAGWRVAFYIIAIASCFGAMLVRRIAKDPPRGIADGYSNISTIKNDAIDDDIDKKRKMMMKESFVSFNDAIALIFRNKTFLAITFQGIWGSVPWKAFVFLTFWLQYTGFSDGMAASINSCFAIGHLLGGLIGGRVGDMAAKRSPNHGRIYVAQFSDLMRLPLILILFRVLPSRDSGATAYALVLFSIGLISPWVSIASNKPILCEIVAPNLRGQIFAYQRLIEQSSAALFGAPLVGWLCENVFGYQLPSRGSHQVGINHANAHALARSMEAITLVCWGLCFFLYGVVHFTYPADKRRREKEVKSGVMKE